MMLIFSQKLHEYGILKYCFDVGVDSDSDGLDLDVVMLVYKKNFTLFYFCFKLL